MEQKTASMLLAIHSYTTASVSCFTMLNPTLLIKDWENNITSIK